VTRTDVVDLAVERYARDIERMLGGLASPEMLRHVARTYELLAVHCGAALGDRELTARYRAAAEALRARARRRDRDGL
jgi:hypothetical protein